MSVLLMSDGGMVETPNLDRLATGGVRFNQFYNGARCARSSRLASSLELEHTGSPRRCPGCRARGRRGTPTARTARRCTSPRHATPGSDLSWGLEGRPERREYNPDANRYTIP